LEDAENVLHVRSGKIARVDRDVFAAVADWDLDQSNVCITLISLLLLSRHDDRESFLNRNRSKVCCPRNRQQKHRRNDEKLFAREKQKKYQKCQLDVRNVSWTSKKI